MKNRISICFRARTNKDYCAINTAIFKKKNGEEITIDRDTTYYSIEDGILDMEWESIYVWDGEGADYSITSEEINRLEFVRFELEEDFDADYCVEDVEWECGII